MKEILVDSDDLWVFFFFCVLPDIDECARGDMCLGGVCANTEGSFICSRCRAGYRVSLDQQSCEGKFNSQLCFSLSGTH